MIVLPAMSGPQTASWHGVMDLHEHLAYGWTMIGGQLVHLHCAERGLAVTVEGRAGHVRRPDLVGALVMKASAHTAVGDPAKGRHRFDFVTLAALLAARDFRDVELSKKDRQRLRAMLAASRADQEVMLGLEDAAESLDRLARAAGLTRG